MKYMLRTTVMVTALAFAANASAFGLSNITGGSKDSGGSSGPSVSDVAAKQEKMVKEYTAAQTNINKAQLMMSKALGLKKQVASLTDEAKVLGSGSVLDKDGVKKVSAISSSANKAISQKIKSGQKLSTESKKELAESLVPFGLGLKQTKDMSSQFKPYIDSAMSAIKSAPMTEKLKAKSKLAAGLYVAKNTPGLLSGMIGTGKQMMDYMQSQNVKVPAKATSALGSL